MKTSINRHLFVRWTPRVLLFAAMTGVLWAQPVQRPFKIVRPLDYSQDEVLIQYKNHVNEAAARAMTMGMGSGLGSGQNNVQSVENMPRWKGPLHVLKLTRGMSVDTAITQISQNPDVEYVQPNYIYHLTNTPTDPTYAQSWGLHNTGQTVSSASYSTNNPGTSGKDINAQAAWDVITDCSSVTVAVVDSGVNYNHEDLSANVITGSYSCPSSTTGTHGCNFTSYGSANDPIDMNGHGTHVAGIIGAAASNSKGTTGVCWTAKILAVRVMDPSGSGTTANIVSGLNFAVANGAKVVNMSLGGSSSDPTFISALDNAATNDVVVVVAAGNSNQYHNANHSYPCDYSEANIICVAAADQSYARASFSDYDSNATASSRQVDIAAPGTNILSTYTGVYITEDFSSGWTISPSGHWVHVTAAANATCTGFSVDMITNPGSGTTWCQSGTPANSLDDRTYKNFDLSGYSKANLTFYTWLDLSQTGDKLKIGYSSSGGDPFSVGSGVAYSGSIHTGGFSFVNFDLSSCLTSGCTVGFDYVTDTTANSAGDGSAIAQFSILGINSTTYKVLDGTSMATPMVAGIATMVRARNPSYTYTDTVNAILNGGDAASAFASNTKSGKTANAYGALQYIPAPSGFTLSSP